MASIFRRFPGDDLDSSDSRDYLEAAAPAWVQDSPGQCASVVLGEFFEPASGPAYFGVLKRWTGATWARAELKRWTGAAWVAAVLKRWTGSAWVQVDTEG